LKTPEAFKDQIYVTKPFMPPLEEFSSGLREIWQNKWLTNHGPVLKRFEQKLARFVRSSNLCLFNNGTLALQVGLQGLRLSGEVITTPFTFVATTHALYWNKIRPVFCDIEPDYYTLDPERVEESITPWTTAILAVHIFGHPCYLQELQDIASRYNLSLIYDAAHAFGVQVAGQPISDYGDLSMFSFHATKLFHSLEGGMLVFQDPDLKTTFNYLQNFGFENELEVVMPGTNAKMNEMQALMGELNLEYLQAVLDRRKDIDSVYRERLHGLPGLHLTDPPPAPVEHNYSFFPVLIDGEEFGMSRDELYQALKRFNVFTRRYFYPLVCDYPCYRSIKVRDGLPVARKVSSRILTLPIYYDLGLDDVHKICDIICYLQKQV